MPRAVYYAISVWPIYEVEGHTKKRNALRRANFGSHREIYMVASVVVVVVVVAVAAMAFHIDQKHCIRV